jgi:RNA polymerase sigma-70 factor (ECF subfamily)
MDHEQELLSVQRLARVVYDKRAMGAPASLQSTLDAVADAAAAAWPAFRLERGAFQQRLLAGIDPATEGAREALLQLHAADLYLAMACDLGIAQAIEAFAIGYLARVDAYLKRFGNSTIRPEDVRRELEDTLLFGRAGTPARIGQYAGRGPLERFVARAARNAALSMLRARPPAKDANDLDELASHLAAPFEGHTDVIAARYEEVVRDALRASLAVLDRRQRTIVRLHLLQGVSLTQIARMLQVHQSTVSRAFAAASVVIYDGVRRHLQDRKGMSDSEMQSIVRDVRHRIDASLSLLLGDTRRSG